jgi:hypothetical protein
MKSIFVAAMIAAACSGVALTGEVKQNQSATAAAVRAQVMGDAGMGKVTAGLFIILPQGYVIAPADVSRSFPKWTARRTRSVRDSNSADGNVWSG